MYIIEEELEISMRLDFREFPSFWKRRFDQLTTFKIS